jgi:hypothetical protein
MEMTPIFMLVISVVITIGAIVVGGLILYRIIRTAVHHGLKDLER